jgi:hypothetical protein
LVISLALTSLTCYKYLLSFAKPTMDMVTDNSSLQLNKFYKWPSNELWLCVTRDVTT